MYKLNQDVWTSQDYCVRSCVMAIYLAHYYFLKEQLSPQSYLLSIIEADREVRLNNSGLGHRNFRIYLALFPKSLNFTMKRHLQFSIHREQDETALLCPHQNARPLLLLTEHPFPWERRL